MARKNPLPQIETLICQRLRDFRINVAGMTVVEFARRLDIDSNRLSSYEHARVPLRYEFANRVCRTFNICQRWLAEGEEPQRYYVNIAAVLSVQFQPKAIFSSVYIDILKPLLDEHINAARHLWSGELPEDGLTVMQEMGNNRIGQVDAVFVLNFSCSYLAQQIGSLPPDLYQSFFNNMIAGNRKFILEHRDRIEAWRKSPKESVVPSWANKKSAKKYLTNVSEYVNNESVKPQLPVFLERLKKAAAERGKKTALAKFLGVPLASVSQWLSGEREPGGETTLRLLHWVEQQERQK